MKKIIGLLIFTLFITGCESRSSCVETWHTDDNEQRSCKFDDVSPKNGYRLIDNQWFYVSTSTYSSQCGLKLCRSEYRDYYLMSKDLEHFQILKDNYAKDHESVYRQQNNIHADPETFRVIDSQYSVDATQVFLKNEPISQAKPELFSVIAKKGLYTYSTDGQSVFIEEKMIQGADAQTFKLFEQLPSFMGIYWSHDQSHLYYLEKQVPIKLNMAKFRYLMGSLFTDGQHVIEIKSGLYENVKIRSEIKLPLTILTHYLAVDAKNQVITARTFDLDVSDLVKNINGNNIKLIGPTYPLKNYPHIVLNRSEALRITDDESYFEDGKYVYYVRSGHDVIYEFAPIFQKVSNKPIYLFKIGNTDTFIHNDTLYRKRYYKQEEYNYFTSTKIHGELIGPVGNIFSERRYIFADSAGFINFSIEDELNDNLNQYEIPRTAKSEEFGPLRLYKQSLPEAAYIFENNYFIYINWKQGDRSDVVINKKDLNVQYHHSTRTGNVPEEETNSILISLGLIKRSE